MACRHRTAPSHRVGKRGTRAIVLLRRFPLKAARVARFRLTAITANTPHALPSELIGQVVRYDGVDELSIAPACDFVAGQVAVAVAINVAEIALPVRIDRRLFE